MANYRKDEIGDDVPHFKKQLRTVRYLKCKCKSQFIAKYPFYHLPPGLLSLRKEEPLPELFPQTPVPSYSWPRSTQVADKIVSPSCFSIMQVHTRILFCCGVTPPQRVTINGAIICRGFVTGILSIESPAFYRRATALPQHPFLH